MAGSERIYPVDTGMGSPGLPFYTRQELARSPSVLQGMDPDTERRNRLQYTTFIQDVGMDLEVPQWAIYTAVYLCHQYFAKRSFQRNDKYLVAVACLYLGCKVQESPKYLRDVIKCAETRKWAKWCDEHPTERRKWEDPDHLERVRAEVLTAERAVLYTLCFQLRIQAPYSTVLQLTKGQKDGQDTTNLIQMAWQLVNDSLKTQVSLIYPPEELGAACVFFAHTMLGIEPVTADGSPFCEYARITAERIEEILELLLSVYTTVLLPQGLPPAAQPSVKHEPFAPAGGPGIQVQHNRLVVVSAEQVQQARQLQQQQEQRQDLQVPALPAAAQGQPVLTGSQQQQQPPRSLTTSPNHGQQQQQQAGLGGRAGSGGA